MPSVMRAGMTATANDSPSGFTSQLPSNRARTVDRADYKECVLVDAIDDEVRVDAPKAEAGTTHVRAGVAEARELREQALPRSHNSLRIVSLDTPVSRAAALMLTPSTTAEITAFRFSDPSWFMLFVVHTQKESVKRNPLASDTFCVYNRVVKKRGRPPKPLPEKKSRRLDVRVSEAEKTAFKLAADNANQELSAWIRVQLYKAAHEELPAAIGVSKATIGTDNAKHGKTIANRPGRV